MLNKELNLIFFLLFLYQVRCDFAFARQIKRTKEYNKFENQIGTYCDVSSIYLVIIFILLRLGKITFPNRIIPYINNLMLVFVYSGFVKVIIQNIIRVKYNLEKYSIPRFKSISLSISRFLMIFSYLIYMMCMKSLLVNMNEGFTKRVFLIIFTIIIAKLIGRTCWNISIDVEGNSEVKET